MTQVSATEAARDLPKLLDAVQRGERVLVEHSGHRFQLIKDESVPLPAAGEALFTIKDPAVLEGNWTWGTDESGQLNFQPRTSKARTHG